MAPVIAAAPSMARASDLSPSFATKLAAYRYAKGMSAAFDENVLIPACDRFESLSCTVPHVEVGPHPHTGRTDSVTTADILEVRDARRLVRDVAAGKSHLETDRYPSLADHFDFSTRLAAAADAREARIQKLRDRFRIDEYETRSEELINAASDAFNVMVAHPVESPSELAAKIEAIEAQGAHESTKVLDALKADAHRLAGRGA